MPDDKDMNHERRRFLTKGAGIVGGIGLGVSAWPFIASMNPSAHAKAIGAPITVDISRLRKGELVREKWQGKPVWILRRTDEMLKTLKEDESLLRDPESTIKNQPEYAQNQYRSIKPEYLVLVGICTHLGCSPTFRPDVGADDLGGASWYGGFFCACHGSRFDLAGRVYKNVPAPTNLFVPPYRFEDDKTLVVGESEEDIA